MNRAVRGLVVLALVASGAACSSMPTGASSSGSPTPGVSASTGASVDLSALDSSLASINADLTTVNSGLSSTSEGDVQTR